MIDQDTTVMITTSPIPSHPSTEIIERVIQSIRFHLPLSRIIIMADGVRPSVEHRRAQYTDYKKNLKTAFANDQYVEIREFSEPMQQARMMRECLKTVSSPFVLFVEHDVLLNDLPINWHDISRLLLSQQANMVRFYAWTEIWHEHAYLMEGKIHCGGSTFVKTRQYSQWPNIATTTFYRQILSEHFHPGSRVMIETIMASPVMTRPWEDFKVVIYYPLPANRMFHLNARVGADGRKDPGEW